MKGNNRKKALANGLATLNGEESGEQIELSEMGESPAYGSE